jgi:hypothetical protein
VEADRSLRAIAAFRAVGGLSVWVAPDLVARVYGGTMDPGSRLWSRLAGTRETALAVGPLLSAGADRDRWLRVGLACDLADMGATVLGTRRRGFSPWTTGLSLATYAVSATLTAAALRSNGAAPSAASAAGAAPD